MCIKDIFESWERFGVTRAVQSISFCFRWGINASYKKAASRTRDNAGGLAKAIGKSYVTIQSWEKEASYPNAESIVDMCHLLDVRRMTYLAGMRNVQEASTVYRRMRECC